MAQLVKQKLVEKENKIKENLRKAEARELKNAKARKAEMDDEDRKERELKARVEEGVRKLMQELQQEYAAILSGEEIEDEVEVEEEDMEVQEGPRPANRKGTAKEITSCKKSKRSAATKLAKTKVKQVDMAQKAAHVAVVKSRTSNTKAKSKSKKTPISAWVQVDVDETGEVDVEGDEGHQGPVRTSTLRHRTSQANRPQGGTNAQVAGSSKQSTSTRPIKPLPRRGNFSFRHNAIVISPDTPVPHGEQFPRPSTPATHYENEPGAATLATIRIPPVASDPPTVRRRTRATSNLSDVSGISQVTGSTVIATGPVEDSDGTTVASPHPMRARLGRKGGGRGVVIVIPASLEGRFTQEQSHSTPGSPAQMTEAGPSMNPLRLETRDDKARVLQEIQASEDAKRGEGSTAKVGRGKRKALDSTAEDDTSSSKRIRVGENATEFLANGVVTTSANVEEKRTTRSSRRIREAQEESNATPFMGGSGGRRGAKKH